MVWQKSGQFRTENAFMVMREEGDVATCECTRIASSTRGLVDDQPECRRGLLCSHHSFVSCLAAATALTRGTGEANSLLFYLPCRRNGDVA